MHVISRRKLVEFYEVHPQSEKALKAWFHIAKAANWTSSADILAVDPKASVVANNRVIFDVLGGRFRLVAALRYRSGVVFIRFIGTHADYGRIDAATV